MPLRTNIGYFKKEYCETTASLAQVAELNGINYNSLKNFARLHHWYKHKRLTQYLDQKYRPNQYNKLTLKQLTFIYLMCFFNYDATDAYMYAYRCNYNVARVNKYRLLKQNEVKDEIKRVAKIILNNGDASCVPYSNNNLNYVVCRAYGMAKMIHIKAVEHEERLKLMIMLHNKMKH